MYTIHVLTPTLKDGYKPICDYYNANKPADWTPLKKLDRSEGGFSVDLTPTEIKQILELNAIANGRINTDGKGCSEMLYPTNSSTPEWQQVLNSSVEIFVLEK